MFTIEQIKVIKMYRAVYVRRIEIPRSFCLRWSILTIGDIKLAFSLLLKNTMFIYTTRKKRNMIQREGKKKLKVNV